MVNEAVLADIKQAWEFIGKLKNIKTQIFSVEFDISFDTSSKALKTTSVVLKRGTSQILSLNLSLETGDIENIQSSLVEHACLVENKGHLQKRLLCKGTVFRFFGREHVPQKEKQWLTKQIVDVGRLALDKLRLCFIDGKLSHVSPIRAYPRRFYLADQADLSDYEGGRLVESLKLDGGLRDTVNRWLKEFGIEVGIEPLMEVIHRLSVKQRSTSLNLDLPDVGFGVSQVLPVVVQALTLSKKGVLLVEQPEIHLHPKMQAELADLFIDLAKGQNIGEGKGGRFIIETHSTSLLKRIRRRIPEKDNSLEAKDVGLYYIHSDASGGAPVIEEVQIPLSGGFVWPREFYADDLCDTLGFLNAAVRAR